MITGLQTQAYLSNCLTKESFCLSPKDFDSIVLRRIWFVPNNMDIVLLKILHDFGCSVDAAVVHNDNIVVVWELRLQPS